MLACCIRSNTARRSHALAAGHGRGASDGGRHMARQQRDEDDLGSGGTGCRRICSSSDCRPIFPKMPSATCARGRAPPRLPSAALRRRDRRGRPGGHRPVLPRPDRRGRCPADVSSATCAMPAGRPTRSICPTSPPPPASGRTSGKRTRSPSPEVTMASGRLFRIIRGCATCSTATAPSPPTAAASCWPCCPAILILGQRDGGRPLPSRRLGRRSRGRRGHATASWARRLDPLRRRGDRRQCDPRHRDPDPSGHRPAHRGPRRAPRFACTILDAPDVAALCGADAVIASLTRPRTAARHHRPCPAPRRRTLCPVIAPMTPDPSVRAAKLREIVIDAWKSPCLTRTMV